jgi:hypothetical protein
MYAPIRFSGLITEDNPVVRLQRNETFSGGSIHINGTLRVKMKK